MSVLAVLCGWIGVANRIPQSYVHSEFAAIKDTVLEMSKGSFRDLFTMGEDRHLHRTLLAYMNQVFQQISGRICTLNERAEGLNPWVNRRHQPHHLLCGNYLSERNRVRWIDK